MRPMTLALSAALLVGSAMSASAYFAWRVNMLPGNGNFEVIDGPRGGNQRIWCEAAKFAAGPLRARGNTRMYLLHPNGRAKSQANSFGTGFTINPTQEMLDISSRPGDGGNYSVSIKKVGYNLSVSHARGFCGSNVLY
ncbi:hypothetical protein [uncultured Shimia sp.]|uniref:hypothetical protein n=1 Tax=uncultured Shimia sp. TaxID=573152 RepID=UPI00262F5E67|nr:hypothetical protein [uncultured Shimia sp.]